ncbi:SIS domain-containing protein [Phytoactinopolyspora halotolerans]|uniref:Sugar isomerase n=1 Tax=Phytoactinopolyspora halotolerans TaxID=1981512 RepID=A0A6L9S206_9ACTN|nr:sugar isomerase [Phytoactinopolyspora halotolerans]NED99038.1 sugar isomerase [Phytoactinopolyspora halotolerans]
MPSSPHVQDEIDSQPACWERAVKLAASGPGALPVPGERVAVVGCGTSWFMAQAYASLREQRGHGETDAFAASEFPRARNYDRLLAITRSGTTSEVLTLLESMRAHTRTVALTADPATPIADVADELIVLDFADEQSVVQTRFATSALAMLRAHVGDALTDAQAQTQNVLTRPIDDTLPTDTTVYDVLTRRRQFVFLGTGWTVGLAHEAALKMREASLSWSESYPAMDYRHGPISLADHNSVVWFLGGDAPDGLIDEVRSAGAHVVADTLDPMTDLVRIQRLAVALGLAKGLDPDRPRNLDRSVILEAGG